MINIFEGEEPTAGTELLDELYHDQRITINRIQSNQLEDGVWYDQEEDEWLVLLDGEALLEFESKQHPLKKGDTLFIPAHQPHRVKKTSATALWLTLHLPL